MGVMRSAPHRIGEFDKIRRSHAMTGKYRHGVRRAGWYAAATCFTGRFDRVCRSHLVPSHCRHWVHRMGVMCSAPHCIDGLQYPIFLVIFDDLKSS